MGIGHPSTHETPVSFDSEAMGSASNIPLSIFNEIYHLGQGRFCDSFFSDTDCEGFSLVMPELSIVM